MEEKPLKAQTCKGCIYVPANVKFAGLCTHPDSDYDSFWDDVRRDSEGYAWCYTPHQEKKEE